MDLKYLNTFRVIAEEGSFTRAAERLGYTQSTMTFQMGQLEQALSARLFEKVGRRMVLSQAGRQLLHMWSGCWRRSIKCTVLPRT